MSLANRQTLALFACLAAIAVVSIVAITSIDRSPRQRKPPASAPVRSTKARPHVLGYYPAGAMLIKPVQKTHSKLARDPPVIVCDDLPSFADGWELVDVPGDGDCFLHAVYGAAVHASGRQAGTSTPPPGPVATMWSAILKDATGEPTSDAFVECARRRLSNYIYATAKECDAYTCAFDHIQGLATEDRDAVMAELPSWTVTAMRAASDPDEFLAKCVQSIATRGCWFGQLEVHAFARMVRTLYDVEIEISVSNGSKNDTRPDAAAVDPSTTIVLLNTGGGAHYVFLAQNLAPLGTDHVHHGTGGRALC